MDLVCSFIIKNTSQKHILIYNIITDVLNRLKAGFFYDIMFF